MRSPDFLRRVPLGFNMTPLIDVVFLLIIFFLVSSHLAKQENLMPLPLPAATSGQRDPVDQTPRVTVNVKTDGTLLLAGKRIEREELLPRLKNALEQAGPELELRIRSSRMAPYRQVEPVLLACARAGLWNVTFAVIRPEDVR